MHSQESKAFDKIVKENLESFILLFADRFLGISIKESRPIEVKLLTTIEREPDFIRLINSEEQEDYILHIEFQSTNDPEMIYRMVEYKAILLRKFKIPVLQYVVFLGKGKSNMVTHLPANQANNSFELRNFNELKFDDFLSAPEPEAVIMALLTDFRNQSPEWAVEQILRKLKQLCKHEKELQKYLTQLNVLSRLRNLEKVVYQKIEAMPITYDITKDSLYQKGVEKGVERNRREMVQNMLKMGTFKLEDIAQITNTSMEFVLSVQRERSNNSEENQ